VRPGFEIHRGDLFEVTILLLPDETADRSACDSALAFATLAGNAVAAAAPPASSFKP
jgi:hypothetical protein